LAGGKGKGKGILQKLTLRFGDDLNGLVEQTGAASVEVNPNRHVISVTGTAAAFNAVSVIKKNWLVLTYQYRYLL
jgi:hypothetical protein